jgi:hypothetical protein
MHELYAYSTEVLQKELDRRIAVEKERRAVAREEALRSVRRVLTIDLLDVAGLKHLADCQDGSTINGFYSNGEPPDCIRCGLVEIIANESQVPHNTRVHINIEIKYES